MLQELPRRRQPGELCWRLGGTQALRAKRDTLTQLQELQYHQPKNLVKENLRQTVKRA